MRQLVYSNLLLIITFSFICGENKIWSTIRKSLNIINMIVECVQILSWSISFFSAVIVSLMMFCLRWLYCSQHIMWQTIWLVATSWDSFWVVFDLKIWKCNARNIRKCNSPSNDIIIIGKLFHIYKLIHIDLKPRILITSFLLAPLLNNMLMMFLFYRLEKKACYILMFFSPEILFKLKL